MNYRTLYFFHGRERAVVSHGFVKQRADVPAFEIELALRRKRGFEQRPEQHSFPWSGPR